MIYLGCFNLKRSAICMEYFVCIDVIPTVYFGCFLVHFGPSFTGFNVTYPYSISAHKDCNMNSLPDINVSMFSFYRDVLDTAQLGSHQWIQSNLTSLISVAPWLFFWGKYSRPYAVIKDPTFIHFWKKSCKNWVKIEKSGYF